MLIYKCIFNFKNIRARLIFAMLDLISLLVLTPHWLTFQKIVFLKKGYFCIKNINIKKN